MVSVWALPVTAVAGKLPVGRGSVPGLMLKLTKAVLLLATASM